MVYIQYMTNTNRIQNIEAQLNTTLQATRVTTPQGRHVLVSTVDLRIVTGITGWGGRYETMVFHSDIAGEVQNWTELQCNRYDDAQKAIEGHAAVVLEWYEKVALEWYEKSRIRP